MCHCAVVIINMNDQVVFLQGAGVVLIELIRLGHGD